MVSSNHSPSLMLKMLRCQIHRHHHRVILPCKMIIRNVQENCISHRRCYLYLGFPHRSTWKSWIGCVMNLDWSRFGLEFVFCVNVDEEEEDTSMHRISKKKSIFKSVINIIDLKARRRSSLSSQFFLYNFINMLYKLLIYKLKIY